MSKTYNIVMITLLSILIFVLVSFLIVSPKGMFKSEKAKLVSEKTYSVYDFENINIDVKSADIYVFNSQNDEVNVKIYATKSDKVKSEIANGNLDINIRNKNHFCLFCRMSNKVEIYLPESFANKMNIKATSGDMKIESFDNLKLNVHATSGDVNARGIKSGTFKLTSGDVNVGRVNTLKVDLTSGDVEVKRITSSANIEVTSGDVEIDRFDINKNSYIKATSGDVKIESIDNVYVNAKVTSGEIDVNNSDRKAENELKIKTTSGDITVN